MTRLILGLDGRFIQPHYPGVGRYTYNLARFLISVAPDLQLILYYDPRQARSHYDLDSLARLGAELRPIAIAPRSLAEQVVFPFRVTKDRLDIFHAPYFVRPFALSCPTICTIHDANSSVFPRSLPGSRARAIYQASMRLSIRLSRLVITDSSDARKQLVRHFHVDDAKIRVVPIAADPLFRPGLAGSAEANETLTRLGIIGDYLLSVSSNKPLKNLSNLIRAFALVKDDPRLVGVSLVLAGPQDPRYQEPFQLVRSLGISDRTTILGEISSLDLPYLMAAARLFVFPSLAEGFGLPPLEAMASGAPVLCSARSSLPEVCGPAAEYFDPEDVTSIAGAILTTVGSGERREEMRSKGFEQARLFSWERTAELTVDAYRQALAGQNLPWSRE